MPRHNRLPEPDTTDFSNRICSIVGWIWAYPSLVSQHQSPSQTGAVCWNPPSPHLKLLLRSHRSGLPSCVTFSSAIIQAPFFYVSWGLLLPSGHAERGFVFRLWFSYSFQQDELDLASLIGQGRNSMWNTAASGVKWGASAWRAGSPKLFAAALGSIRVMLFPEPAFWLWSTSALTAEVRCRVLMVLVSLLTLGSQIMFFVF